MHERCALLLEFITLAAALPHLASNTLAQALQETLRKEFLDT